MTIGQWIRRFKVRSIGAEAWKEVHGKWHLVESVVADDAVTYCGRRMSNERGLFDTSDVMPLTRMIGQPQLCKVCGGSATA